MSKGTKIVLALGAILVIALVFYYGVGQPDEAVALNIEEPPPPPRVVQPAPPAIVPAQPITPPVESETARRLLRESVEQVVGPPEPKAPADEPASKDDEAPSAVEMTEPTEVVRAGEPTKGDVGTSGPEEVVPASPPPAVAPRTTARPTPAPPPTVEYVVKANDTMVSIAQQWFGDAGKWDLIAKANPLADPDRLRVGQVLRLPPKDAKRDEGSERAGAAPVPYIVKSGDTLSRIAGQYYGNSALWRIIYDANRGVIGDDPNTLRVGMRLTIPPAPRPAQR